MTEKKNQHIIFQFFFFYKLLSNTKKLLILNGLILKLQNNLSRTICFCLKH
jgi:hypothetical protein